MIPRCVLVPIEIKRMSSLVLVLKHLRLCSDLIIIIRRRRWSIERVAPSSVRRSFRLLAAIYLDDDDDRMGQVIMEWTDRPTKRASERTTELESSPTKNACSRTTITN